MIISDVFAARLALPASRLSRRLPPPPPPLPPTPTIKPSLMSNVFILLAYAVKLRGLEEKWRQPIVASTALGSELLRLVPGTVCDSASTVVACFLAQLSTSADAVACLMALR